MPSSPLSTTLVGLATVTTLTVTTSPPPLSPPTPLASVWQAREKRLEQANAKRGDREHLKSIKAFKDHNKTHGALADNFLSTVEYDNTRPPTPTR